MDFYIMHPDALPWLMWGLTTLVLIAMSVCSRIEREDYGKWREASLINGMMAYYFYLCWVDEIGGVFHEDDERDYVLLQRWWHGLSPEKQEAFICQLRRAAHFQMDTAQFKLLTHQATVEELVKANGIK